MRMATTGGRCIFVGLAEGISAYKCSEGAVALTNCHGEGSKILPYLCFGLNVAPLIMKAIIDAVLSQDEAIANVTSAYIDNIYVNESLIPVARVRDLLSKYGLVCKEPTRLEDGTKVLGLQVTMVLPNGGEVKRSPISL